MTTTVAVRETASGLFRRGFFLQAYRALQDSEQPADADGIEARLLFAATRWRLGGARPSRLIVLREFRLAPEHPAVLLAAVESILHARGPYAAWQLARRDADLSQGREEERARWLGLRARSAVPGRALFWARSVSGDIGGAFATLEHAIESRPLDRELTLFGAEMCFRFGRAEKGSELLEQARGDTQRSPWLRTAAALARYQGNLQWSLQIRREILDEDPLDVEICSDVLSLLESIEGRASAREHIDRAVERFPEHRGLARLRVEFRSAQDPAAAREALEAGFDPDRSGRWGRRELGALLGQLSSADEGLADLDAPDEEERRDPAFAQVRGDLFARRGDRSSAGECFRKAVSSRPGWELPMRSWLSVLRTDDERREALHFVEGCLTSPFADGDGVLAYRERAVALAVEAADRFSLVVRIWLRVSVARGLDVCRGAHPRSSVRVPPSAPA
jgi:tetratricopeptide (TPR) repeat protein